MTQREQAKVAAKDATHHHLVKTCHHLVRPVCRTCQNIYKNLVRTWSEPSQNLVRLENLASGYHRTSFETDQNHRNHKSNRFHSRGPTWTKATHALVQQNVQPSLRITLYETLVASFDCWILSCNAQHVQLATRMVASIDCQSDSVCCPLIIRVGNCGSSNYNCNGQHVQLATCNWQHSRLPCYVFCICLLT